MQRTAGLGPRPHAPGLLDPLFGTQAGGVERALWLDASAGAGADIVRISARWAEIAPTGPPTDPTNPADPGYTFSRLDGAVIDATNRGLQVMLTVGGSPDWAEGPGRATGAPTGTWDPDPGAYGDFARALAERYSGSFEVRSGFLGSVVARLPRVVHYQAWNEPNLSQYLGPQSNAGAAASPEIYRALLNNLHDGVKEISGDNVVVTGGTAPFGDDAGGQRVRPMAFWRELLCMKGRKRPRATACPTPARFDVLAHHPINTVGGPRDAADHRDDATIPDMRRLRRLLRAAERAGTIDDGLHRIWVTELWWETDPPDASGISLARQARWIELSFYELWRQRVDAAFVLGIRDQPGRGAPGRASLQSGLYFHDGGAKPALTAFRFPFVADRLSRRTVGLFTIPPARGRLVIQRRTGHRWRKVLSRPVNAGSTRFFKVRSRSRVQLRAQVGGERSLTWRLR